MTTFTIILTQLLNFFFMIAVGYVAAKLNVISDAGKDTLSKLFTTILLPSFFFVTLYGAFTWDDLVGAAPMLFIALGIYGFYAVLFAILSFVLPIRPERRKVFQAMFTFINLPAIGYPLIGVLHPNVIGIYIPAICLVDSLSVWTYGVWLSTDQNKDGQKQSFSLKRLINPATIMVIVALTITLAKIPVPSLIMNPMIALSKAANPVCMLYLGALLASTDLKRLFSFKEIYMGIAIKMLLVPLALAPLFKSLSIPPEMVNVALIMASLPTMSVLPVLVKENGTEVEFATGGTLVTTLVSVVTMSIVAYIGMV
ncbi:MAG TPA: hypothetical protein GX717_01200 [Clostridiaceae bacterium]|nr:hypothetical protein [Clostridiaceae bacterium]